MNHNRDIGVKCKGSRGIIECDRMAIVKKVDNRIVRKEAAAVDAVTRRVCHIEQDSCLRHLRQRRRVQRDCRALFV